MAAAWLPCSLYLRRRYPSELRKMELRKITTFRFAAAILRFAPPPPANRQGVLSRLEPQLVALRRFRRRIARVRSYTVRRLPTWRAATCKVLACLHRTTSGRHISRDPTFRRRSPAGSRAPQRPQRRRYFVRSSLAGAISWSTASAFSVIRSSISTEMFR